MSQNNTNPEEEKKPTDESAQDESQNKKEDENTSNDYKVKLEEVQKELSQAQHKIVELKKSNKDSQIDNDDQDNVDETINKKIDEKLSQDRTLRVNDIISEELDKISNNEDEKKLIKLLFENKIVRTNDSRAGIKKDLDAAKILANADKTAAMLREAEVAIKNNPSGNSAGGSSAGSFKSDSVDNDTNWNSADQALLARYGLDPNKINRK